MRLACQIVVTLLTIAGFFMVIHKDVVGQREKPPEGFSGVVWTILIYAGTLALYWGAGCFDGGWFK